MTVASLGPRGAGWLFEETSPSSICLPETLRPEHRSIAATAERFVRDEVDPALGDLERREWGVARRLATRAGALDLFTAGVPEWAGGAGLDTVAATIVAEAIGAAPSFSMTFGAQTGLMIVPLVCFGTSDQQARYLPRLLTGEIIGAYCLSEAGSGSDALAARTTAIQQPDGSWVLDGEKLWITNGGFADLFIVFARANVGGLSAFLVERAFPGVASGAEERKTGLHGSSTTPIALTGVTVPAANLLGQAGDGRRIAFSVLNYGRFKLAATCSGGARAAIAEAVAYACTRRQFGRPISGFGAIQHKLAEMTIRAYGVESMLYRTAGLLDAAAIGTDRDGAPLVSALDEFAVESSLLKIGASEMLDYVADELVQIHGGYGFVEDYPAARRARDARANRIFEGTNEINRVLAPGLLVKRAARDRLPPLDASKALADLRRRVLTPAAQASEARLDYPRRIGIALKDATIYALGVATDIHGDRLAEEQEILMLVSDMLLAAFATDSAALRAAHAAGAGLPAASLHEDVAVVAAHDAAVASAASVGTALAALPGDDTVRAVNDVVVRALDAGVVNTVAARRRIAEAVIEHGRFPFDRNYVD